MARSPLYVSQEQLGAPGAAQITVPRLENPIGEAAARMGAAAMHLGAQLHRAEGVTKRAQGEARYLTALDEMKRRYAGDPDWATAGKRFAEEHAKLRGDVLKELAGYPEHQAVLGERMTRPGLAAENFVTAAAMRAHLAASRDAEDTIVAHARRDAAEAPTPAQRKDAVERATDVLADHASAGITTPEHAEARRTQLLEDIHADTASSLIAHDPDAAATVLDDPESFAHLSPARRLDLYQQALDAGDARDAATSSGAITLGGLALAREGKLDKTFLDANEGALSLSDYARLARMTKPGAPRLDAATYRDLLQTATEGEGALYAAADAYHAGRIDRAAFDRVYDMTTHAAADREGRPWANAQRWDLLEALKPSRAQDNGAAFRQLHAVGDYEKFLAESPDASAEDGAAQVREIAGRARHEAAESERAALAPPRFIAVPRNKIDADAIAAAAEKLGHARAIGGIDDDEFAGEAELLQAWQDVLGRMREK